MLTNLNVRKLGNGAVLVQYQEDGKSRDAGFASWNLFLMWLDAKLNRV